LPEKIQVSPIRKNIAQTPYIKLPQNAFTKNSFGLTEPGAPYFPSPTAASTAALASQLPDAFIAALPAAWRES
jgi:hypothetical protein